MALEQLQLVKLDPHKYWPNLKATQLPRPHRNVLLSELFSRTPRAALRVAHGTLTNRGRLRFLWDDHRFPSTNGQASIRPKCSELGTQRKRVCLFPCSLCLIELMWKITQKNRDAVCTYKPMLLTISYDAWSAGTPRICSLRSYLMILRLRCRNSSRLVVSTVSTLKKPSVIAHDHPKYDSKAETN